MATIASIRAELNAALDSLKEEYGENTELTGTPLDLTSAAIDNVNETNNPNLPDRPHA